ncbi:U-box domain-containing protein 4 [Dichanthelium oligosanthes]|uniref:RING-type E3 ubiquitin transferase n=1 Tax=Dichanthelium oligosanthes TaxID=888268 RepID=A0A1E5VYD3_9POAL|nr:U-box domain-containing protein 4 [Dichanthelium oligosanthes]
MILANYYMKVTQVESLITEMQKYVFEVCQIVNSLMLPSETNCISVYLEKAKQFHFEKMTAVIGEASRDLAGKVMPKSETLTNIQVLLSLSTNQELLMEAVALSKIKMRVSSEDSADLDGINDLSKLVNYMLDKHVEEKQMHSINGVPIPADFCCPLSLELMSDPVIVASGQTYERVFIRKWLDLGYNVCPKTRQTLGHTNLIPNYTVKQLIENWSEIHGIMLPDPVELLSLSFPVSLNLTNDSTSDKSRLSDNSPRSNKSGSPEHKVSSDDSHHHNLRHDDSDSDDQISKASSFEDTDDSESDALRLPLAATEANKSTCNKTIDGYEAIKQLRKYGLHVSDVEQHLPSSGSSSDIGTGTSSSSNHLEAVAKHEEEQFSSNSSASESTRNDQMVTSSKVEPNGMPRFGGVRSRSQLVWRQLSDKAVPADSRSESPDVDVKVRRLIEDLKNESTELQRAATGELLVLSRHSMENRIAIANHGAIPFLVSLLYSADPSLQESVVTVLLNLSINDNNKIAIASANAIEALIHVLETGSPEAKANSAATLFSLSVNEENKAEIGRSGAIKPLVDLLQEGNAQGKKDAATALFNLSIFHENKARIIEAGAVKPLVELMDPAAGMVDKAVSVLAILATVQEGRNGIAQAGGIPMLVEVVELGSARAKENAAAALLQLCTNNSRFCSLVLQEGAMPPLVALSQSGTARAREKVLLHLQSLSCWHKLTLSVLHRFSLAFFATSAKLARSLDGKFRSCRALV